MEAHGLIPLRRLRKGDIFSDGWEMYETISDAYKGEGCWIVKCSNIDPSRWTITRSIHLSESFCQEGFMKIWRMDGEALDYYQQQINNRKEHL